MKTTIAQRAFNATADGQRAMFWDAHKVNADSLSARMAEMQYEAGRNDAIAGLDCKNPSEPNYAKGYMHGKESI